MKEKTATDNLHEDALSKEQSDQKELLQIITACRSRKVAEELLKWYTI